MAGHVAACSEREISLERKSRLVNGKDFTPTHDRYLVRTLAE
jgi:hypothetical protein